ncbi:MAG TPA: hypothetical protein VI565_10905, partial [Burkholderiales bacterium]|nr:hypothetical protein [Burkholderiales bacterium]
PAGNDSGNEWIELFNPNVFAIDVSGFEIRALHGDPETFTLDDGTTVGAREFLVVEFTRGQFLDNVDETIVILDPFGAEYDRTPVSNDTENDNLTWQRRADGEKSWAFASMTRGFSNGG